MKEIVTLATIGFTGTTAEGFFGRLTKAAVERVIDVRLRNTSQLAGFAKARDLAYFLKAIADIGYVHEPLLAPSEEIFRAYKIERGDWSAFERRFLDLMAERQVETRFSPDFFAGGCLLCSEAKPHKCHRRLVADYLNQSWKGALEVRHL